MTKSSALPANALASQYATYRIRREWVDDYRTRSYLILAVAVVVAVVGLLDPSDRRLWPVVLAVGAAGAHHYRVSIRDARYRFEISPYGVRGPPSGDWVPWASVTTLRERLVFNRIDLVDHHRATRAWLHFEIAEFDDVLAHVMGCMARATEKAPVRFTRTWDADSIFGIVGGAILIGGGVVGLVAGAWESLVSIAIGVLLGLAQLSEVSRTEVGPRTLSWKQGGRRREADLRTVAGVRLVLRRSKYGSHLQVLIEGPDGATDVRPKGADPFAVYRSLLAGRRVAGSSPLEGHPTKARRSDLHFRNCQTSPASRV